MKNKKAGNGEETNGNAGISGGKLNIRQNNPEANSFGV